MKPIGTVVFLAGALIGSWLSVQDATEMSWAPYVAALVVTIVGVALLRRASGEQLAAETASAQSRATLEAAIGRIVTNIEELDDRKAKLSPYDAAGEIDRLFAEDLASFADGRQHIAQACGLDAFAAVMNEFAAGERHLNRVWSASIDGYVDEVAEYLGRARAQFVATREAVRAAYR